MTSAAWTTSSVSGLGNSWLTSMPRSASAWMAVGRMCPVGADPAERTWTRPAGQVLGQSSGHLGAAGVVHAHEQQLRQRLGGVAGGLRCSQQLLPGEPFDQHGQEVRDRGDRLQGGSAGGDRGLDFLAGERAGVPVGQVVDEAGVVGLGDGARPLGGHRELRSCGGNVAGQVRSVAGGRCEDSGAAGVNRRRSARLT
jgi:hypothetical protein